jgi:hypothetical protein
MNWLIASAVLILGILIDARLVPTPGSQRTGLAVVPFAQVGLRTLPALVLVDAGGTVAEVWEGSLDSSREADVMTILGSRRSHP